MAMQIHTRWRRRLNNLIKQAMVRNITGFGPPKIVLTEHPKSGGTWVSQMIAEYLDIPNPLDSLPPHRRCILHGHYLHVADTNDIIVMWRDGRDVVVSHYYYHLFHRRTTMPGWAGNAAGTAWDQKTLMTYSAICRDISNIASLTDLHTI